MRGIDITNMCTLSVPSQETPESRGVQIQESEQDHVASPVKASLKVIASKLTKGGHTVARRSALAPERHELTT